MNQPLGVPVATMLVRLDMALVVVGVRPRMRVVVDPQAMSM